MMKNILVTGGGGYIGSHVVVELAVAGYRPIILDNFSNSDKAVIARLKRVTGQDITAHEADYQDIGRLREIVRRESIDGVIHIAAFKAVGESVAEPLKYYQNNAAGFVALVQTLLECGVSNLVFSSSAAVYGNPLTAPVTEETPCAPTSPYGWSKYMDEIILRDVCHANPSLKGTALRYFNVVGAHDSGIIGELPKGKPQNLLPIIVQSLVGKLPPLTVFGTDYPTPDGTCQRDYIHVVDLAKAHIAALSKNARKKRGGFAGYNIGTGKPTSVLELIKIFERVNGVAVPHTLGDRRPGDPATCYASADKAARELDWHATQTIEDAIRTAWQWQQQLVSPLD